MTDYIRRLVSGNKARFKDEVLDLELDLVYVTDQVIIMGYPASGMESMYRNRREDAKKFLEHRHGKNFWIFNFCPIRENSYPASTFDGRVSRYPFPDHHAPPLAMMPLVAREMRAWLEGSDDRVAVLHCKAGKGRSGTMACSYLLALGDSPSPPRLPRSYSAKQWAKKRVEDVVQSVPEDNEQLLEGRPDNTGLQESTLQPVLDKLDTPSPATLSPASAAVSSGDPASALFRSKSLKDVLDLHTSRRMKPPTTPDSKLKQGVSIPSQRRWLYYWSLLISNEAPSHLWPTTPLPEISKPKVCLTEIKLRMKGASGMKMNVVMAASKLVDRANLGKAAPGRGQIWVSVARYDDRFVDLLEKWERHSRDEGHIGRRKKGSDHMGEEPLSDIFVDGSWDKGKMICSFARMGNIEGIPTQMENSDEHTKIFTHTLRPLSETNWAEIRNEIQQDSSDLRVEHAPSATNSMYDVGQTAKVETGIVLDACREVRVKLYQGQVFMGWLWFIPAFHMSGPRTSSQSPTKFVLTRKEIDFPLGVGAGIVDVEISLEWYPETDELAGRLKPSKEAGVSSGLVAGVQAMTTDDIPSAPEARQVADDQS